ncbi:hypothetical protein BDY21DRAFT_185385 [Lineolata rhizophorae]|uniref:Uncharacterized protein n=1 Tax=Lineolata rhizophorae TaxID=578093 RepID=A0A6A6P805_9PEZI|nr:hypothetical protein BDY21DRAFT_185385 [Lineolata rhizophorae]
MYSTSSASALPHAILVSRAPCRGGTGLVCPGGGARRRPLVPRKEMKGEGGRAGCRPGICLFFSSFSRWPVCSRAGSATVPSHELRAGWSTGWGRAEAFCGERNERESERASENARQDSAASSRHDEVEDGDGWQLRYVSPQPSPPASLYRHRSQLPKSPGHFRLAPLLSFKQVEARAPARRAPGCIPAAAHRTKAAWRRGGWLNGNRASDRTRPGCQGNPGVNPQTSHSRAASSGPLPVLLRSGYVPDAAMRAFPIYRPSSPGRRRPSFPLPGRKIVAIPTRNRRLGDGPGRSRPRRQPHATLAPRRTRLSRKCSRCAGTKKQAGEGRGKAGGGR